MTSVPSESSPPSPDAIQEAQALLDRAAECSSQGRLVEAVRAAATAAEVFKAAAQRDRHVDALLRIGAALRGAGDHSAAMATFDEAETVIREIGDRLRLAQVLRQIGICSSLLGRHQHAMVCLNEAMEIAQGQDADLWRNVRLSLNNAINRQADPLPSGSPECRAALEPQLARWQTLADDFGAAGDARLEAMALGNLAITLHRVGRPADAAAALQALLGRYRALKMRPNEIICEEQLGRCHQAMGQPAVAREHFRRAIDMLADGGSLDDLQLALDGLSAVEEQLGHLAAALAALREWRRVGERKSDEAARNAVSQRELRIELARLTSQWAQQATQDPLTGLANRRALDQWLAPALARAAHGEPLVLLLMDLDHFKQVNDNFGHDVGDTVLRRVAQLIRQHCRSSDLAVRYGGEEFLLALAGAPAVEAADIAERLRAAVQAHDWQRVRPGLVVTVSMGLTSADEAGDAAGLLTLADRRLYAAKYGGRNRLVVD
jgi:diguanylate cyclase (GGDEF)-like protein